MPVRRHPSSSPDAKPQPKPNSRYRAGGKRYTTVSPESKVGFEAVAEKVELMPKQSKWGQRTGKVRTVYFADRDWERLKAKCDARGISVSRYLQTLAEMSLEGER